MSPTRYWNEILRAPAGTYRLLCANCNWEHRLSLRAQIGPTTYYKVARVREAAIRHYGGVCAKCGHARFASLQLDHVNSGGCAERRASISRTKYYRDATQAPPGTFQVLCANHNLDQEAGDPGRESGTEEAASAVPRVATEPDSRSEQGARAAKAAAPLSLVAHPPEPFPHRCLETPDLRQACARCGAAAPLDPNA